MWNQIQQRQRNHQQPQSLLDNTYRMTQQMPPRLMASVSAPSKSTSSSSSSSIGVDTRRTTQRMGTFHHHSPALDSSFRSSDMSVMSDSAASGSRRSWICTRCSYRNCDKVQNICALCGLNTTGNNGGRRTIFTIDSSIQLVPRPTATLTTSSASTKVMSNTTTTTTTSVNKSNNLKRRLGRPRAEDDEEVVQPPTVFHHSFSRDEAQEEQQNQPQQQSHQSQDMEHYDDCDDDEVSIASQDTCRIGSLSDRDSSDRRRRRASSSSSSKYTKSSSSRGSSSKSRGSQVSGLQHPSKLNAEASRTAPKAADYYYSGAGANQYHYTGSGSSSDSDSDAGADAISPTRTSRRKSRNGSVRRGSVIPHDDPIEQPRRRRCRQGSEDMMCESPTKPVRDDDRRDTTVECPPVISTSLDNAASEAAAPPTLKIKKKSSTGRKKKSIKDYIPGLRKSNRHRSQSCRNLNTANTRGGDSASTSSLSTSAAVVASVTPTDVNLTMLKKKMMTIATAGVMNTDKDTNHTLDLQEDEEDEIEEPSFYDNEYHGMTSPSSCRRTYQETSGFRHHHQRQGVVTATPTPGGYLYEI